MRGRRTVKRLASRTLFSLLHTAITFIYFTLKLMQKQEHRLPFPQQSVSCCHLGHTLFYSGQFMPVQTAYRPVSEL
jgi:hypothetical protein